MNVPANLAMVPTIDERMRQAAPDMYAALKLISTHSCERLTSGPGSCWSQNNWTRDAEYSDVCWCKPCIALAAIIDIP